MNYTYGIRTRNPVELKVAQDLTRLGYKIVKNGWPDFLAYDEHGNLRFIEVKPHCKMGLSRRQAKMASLLRTIGIEVEMAFGACVCGGCQTIDAHLVSREPVPNHDGHHGPTCTVCAPLLEAGA